MNIESRRQLRWTDWSILALAGFGALLALLVTFYVATAPRDAESSQEGGRFAGLARDVEDVVLIDTDGRAVRWADLRGKPLLVFFGFTRCPEICPTTVAELSAAIDALGPAAGAVEVAFISVDSERDTSAHLAAYVSSFGPRFRAYAGARAEIDRLVRAFQAFYEYVPTAEDDYTVNHTAITYLMNPQGAVVDVIGYGNPPERTRAQLRAFLS